jgi:hypothetical protein
MLFVVIYSHMTNIKSDIQKLEEGSATDEEIGSIVTGVNEVLQKVDTLADEVLKNDTI